MKLLDKIYIAGHTGLVGKATTKYLQSEGYINLLTASRKELDLTDQSEVEAWFKENEPDFVFLCAARVGGIAANMAEPAEFLRENLMIQTNVIHSSYESKVEKLLFLGSSCIYPRLSQQPMKEEYLLTGPLEPTNEGYAIAKIAGLKLCENYRRQYGFNAITIVPPNIYGPGDDFSERTSHVIGALLRRFHEAKISDSKSVTIWGTGKARREFMFVNDLAEISVKIMKIYDDQNFLNVGPGTDISIFELATIIKNVVGYEGEIRTNPAQPDGMPQKVMDSTRFSRIIDYHFTPLEEGLKKTYDWFLDIQYYD